MIDQNNNITKYNSAAATGKTTKELMILVLEKAANHLKAAKQNMLNKEPVEQGRHIFIVVEILDGLSRTIPVRDDIPHSAETLAMYQTLQFQVEQLVARKSPAEDYDYFIDYFQKLKAAWEQLEDNEQEQLQSNTETISISSYKNLQPAQEAEPITGFDKEGRFEVVT